MYKKNHIFLDKIIKNKEMKNKKIIVSLLSFIALFSCENNDSFVENSLNSNSTITHSDNPVINEILKRGFKKENIIESKDYYIVEGDILFSKDINNYYNSSIKSNLKARHSYSSNLILPENRIITIKIDPSIPSQGTYNWKEAIQKAILEWSNIKGTSLLFVESYESTGDILIKSDNNILSSGVLGATFMPMNGKPGNPILINIDSNANWDSKVGGVVHELAHTVGFNHTNDAYDPNRNYIPNTPANDPNSIVNQFVSNTWKGFTQYDLEAVRFLFPPLSCNSRLAGPIQGTCAYEQYNYPIEYNIYLVGTKQTNLLTNSAWSIQSNSIEFTGIYNGFCKIKVKDNNTIWPATATITRQNGSCTSSFFVSLDNCKDYTYSD